MQPVDHVSLYHKILRATYSFDQIQIVGHNLLVQFTQPESSNREDEQKKTLQNEAQDTLFKEEREVKTTTAIFSCPWSKRIICTRQTLYYRYGRV